MKRAKNIYLPIKILEDIGERNLNLSQWVSDKYYKEFNVKIEETNDPMVLIRKKIKLINIDTKKNIIEVELNDKKKKFKLECNLCHKVVKPLIIFKGGKYELYRKGIFEFHHKKSIKLNLFTINDIDNLEILCYKHHRNLKNDNK